MNEQELKSYKAILTRMLYDFDNICNKYGLEYCVAYGTTIGALRHKGFIPWDDDIDVFMPRADYDKLINMKPTIKNSGYEIIDIDNAGYYLPFAKFSDSNSTLWEFESEPFIYGVYIDIFPLDETDLDVDNPRDIKRDKYFTRYRIANQRKTLKKAFDCLMRGDVKMFCVYLRSSTIDYLMSNYLFTNYKKLDNYCAYKCKGENYVSRYSPYKNDIYPKSMIFPAKDGIFENIKIKIPADAHSYCTHVYGDYMQLPPEEKRITNHEHYFYNLKHRYTPEQIKEIMNVNHKV